MTIEAVDKTDFRNEFGIYNNRLEVGEKGKADFRPHVKLFGHDDRYSMTLGLNIAGSFPPVIDGAGRLVTDDPNYNLLWIPTPPTPGFNDRGGFDWVIVLKKRPAQPFLNFDYDHVLVDAFHQPPLTPADIADGHRQPEYVDHSIAFYMSDRHGVNKKNDADEFRVGKLGHLYRVRLRDALGAESWADWSVVDNSQLRLSMDPAFLATAEFPVTLLPVGDTFGYTTGGAGETSLDNWIRGSNAVGAVGVGISMSVYCSGPANNQLIRMMPYIHTTDLIDDGLTEYVNYTTAGSPKWLTGNFVSLPNLFQGTYICAATAQGGSDIWIRRDSVSGYTLYYRSGNAFPDPISWGGTSSSIRCSIYVTYDPYYPPKNAASRMLSDVLI